MASEIEELQPVTAHNVIIDKLAITFDVPTSQVKLIANRLHEISQHNFARFCGSQNYDVGAKIWLNEHLIREMSTSSCVTVHTLPKRGGYKSCRVEWNPSKVNTDEVAFVVFGDMLEIDFALLGSGIVNRIDLAVDVDNVQIDDLLFHVPKFQLFENRYKSGLTRYIGGRSGNRYYSCYDKRAEIIAHNMKVNPLHRMEVPERPLMRIETRLRPKILWPNLINIENPFQPMELRRFSSGTPSLNASDDCLWLVLAYARYAGFNAALAGFEKRAKSRMLSRILETQEACGWWRPGKLWDGFVHRYDEINSFVDAIDCKHAVGWAC